MPWTYIGLRHISYFCVHIYFQGQIVTIYSWPIYCLLFTHFKLTHSYFSLCTEYLLHGGFNLWLQNLHLNSAQQQWCKVTQCQCLKCQSWLEIENAKVLWWFEHIFLFHQQLQCNLSDCTMKLHSYKNTAGCWHRLGEWWREAADVSFKLPQNEKASPALTIWAAESKLMVTNILSK